MTLRVGLAGLGVHGARYARHLLAGDVPGARLAAVCRKDESATRAFAAEHGIASVREPAELATSPDIDAVVLSLPPALHPDAAAACIANGRPVLVEKPLAPTVRQARWLAEEAARCCAFVMVAQTLRFDDVVRRLLSERDALGRLTSIAINQRFEPSDRPWIDEPGCGGMFLNTGVHGFDLLRHLSGLEPVSVYAEARRAQTARTEDQFAAVVRLEPGGVLATVDNSRATTSRSGRIELVCEHGQLWGDHIHRTLERVRDRSLERLGPIPANPTVPETLRAFVAAVLGGAPPPVTAHDGAAAVEMVAAAQRSAELARPVLLSEVRSSVDS